jgi:hypothetical protein
MDWINDFEKSLLALDECIVSFGKSEPSLEDASLALVALNKLKADFGIVYEQMAKIVSEAMGEIPEFILPDGSKIEKRSASDRKSWMHDALIHEVARRIQDISVDLETGERTMSTEDMIVKVLDFVQPSYWRVKALGELGITADRFCEVGEPKESIIVRKAK